MTKRIKGGPYADNLSTGYDLNEKYYVYGFGGDDTLTAGGGFKSRRLYGQDGNDSLRFELGYVNGNYVGSGGIADGGIGDDEITVNGLTSSVPAGWLKALGRSGNDRITVYSNRAKALGGEGDDEITLSSDCTVDVEARGGSGDDILTCYRVAFSSKGIKLNGDDGNDKVILSQTPEAKLFKVYGGRGGDTLEAQSRFPLSVKEKSDGGVELLYAAYQFNGVTYEQRLVAYGFESIIGPNDEVIWGEQIAPGF